MCHTDDSRAPGPPDPGSVASHGPLVLEAADGNRFAAYRATPGSDGDRGIVILPDIRGLHPFYTDLAQRFAEAGFHSIAIDYFGRSAGVSERDESFEWQEHIPLVTPEHVRSDVGAATEALREDGATSIFTVGFCFGGGHSWRLAATELNLAGVIGFYGRPALLQEVVDHVRSPLLMLIAGADKATPLATFQEVDRELTRAGKEHEMHVYEGAPHSFFDRSFGEWKDACNDAWHRIAEFTERLSG
ncbi:MAG: carboxymethylenebutenolidase [Actinomycetota bacterium]|nr:carboxymethylenebutenolidase [Actinomycetota bacterium]